jgi:nitric oxide reductase subunit B
VVSASGEQLIGPGEILAGQSVWQAMGGMEVGSIWGHGSYVAPDWTADYLHREAAGVLEQYAAASGAASFAAVTAEQQAALRERLRAMIRANTFDPRTSSLAVSAERAASFHQLEKYYSALFTEGRRDYAIPAGAQADPVKLHQLTAFFFWTAWAAVTDRPALKGISYTNNWPHEPLVANEITGDALVWTGVSIIVLLAGISALVWWRGGRKQEHAALEPAPNDWPIFFFVAVAFWNAVGAGLFGFMINPPVALYFMQGLNTTPLHAHGALFGVYGMLGLALTLFCWRAASPERAWDERPLAVSFWLMNAGLMLMLLLSLLPVGLLQTKASVEISYWYARSPEFMQTPLMNTLRWLRVVGDSLFGLGALAFVLFALGLLRKPAPAASPGKAG